MPNKRVTPMIHVPDVRETPHDTFYGMREIIIRDLNRFWLTFGEEIVK